MAKFLKLHVDTGLVPLRKNLNWNLGNFSEYLKGYSSKAENIEVLLRSGVYKVSDPNVVSQIREDFYARGSTADTPAKMVRKVRADVMEKLVRNGKYKIGSAGAASKMRKNFNLKENNNNTPQRILAKVRKEYNAAKKTKKSSVKGGLTTAVYKPSINLNKLKKMKMMKK